MKKVFALLLTMVMVLAMAVPAMAQTEGTAATGKGSISISNPTKGQTYSVYKLFDATVASDGTIAYTGTIPSALSSVFEIVSGTTNNIQVKSTAVDSQGKFTATATKTITDYVGELTSVTVSATSNGTAPLTFQGLDYGYYAVKSSLGTVLSVDSNNPDVNITDKNTGNPGNDATKKIVNSDGTTSTATTAKINDVIKYQVTFTAQNYDANNEFVYQYVITDEASGIEIDMSSFNYTIKKGTESSQYNPTETTKATSVKDENGKVTVTIPWGDSISKTSYYETPATVTITYSAKLTDTVGTNKATVAYNTNSGTTPPETKVYTAQFNLTKVAGESKDKETGKYTKALAGAEFELYADSEGKNRIYVVDNNDGSYTVTATANNVKIVSSDDESKLGKFVIKGLDQDTDYYLKETKAPDGYTLPTELIKVEKGAKKNLTAIQQVNGDVENTKGAKLPSTGGIGTTIFYVIGAVCVLGAGVLLVTRRRMASK